MCVCMNECKDTVSHLVDLIQIQNMLSVMNLANVPID